MMATSFVPLRFFIIYLQSIKNENFLFLSVRDRRQVCVLISNTASYPHRRADICWLSSICIRLHRSYTTH